MAKNLSKPVTASAQAKKDLAAKKLAEKQAKAAAKLAEKEAKAAEKLAVKEAKEKAKAEDKARKERAKDNTPFNLTVSMNNEEFEIETHDLKQAILDLKPAYLKTKIILTVRYGKEEAEFVLMGSRAKRTFSHPLAAEFFAKRIKLALNANE